MSRQSQTFTFDVTCPEPRVWLVLKSEQGEPRVLEMCQGCSTKWTANADLTPGEYRCRYYGGDARRVVYYGAANSEGSVDCGMDALISVKIATETKNPQFAQ